jgi:DNA-binding beta-propeller fold protein YncE
MKASPSRLSAAALAFAVLLGPLPETARPAAPPPINLQPVAGWGAIPETVAFGPTHGGVAVDKHGAVYVSTDSDGGIFVFSPNGNLLRVMGPEYAGTMSLTIAAEGNVEYLYGAHFRRARVFKVRLNGGQPMILPFPKESNVYGPRGEGYGPSAVAAGPDGSIFVADGFGTDYIHKYSADGRYAGSFGGRGTAPGKLMHCQGLAIDSRFGAPLLIACDTDNRRLQYFDLDGNFVQVVATELRRPVAAALFGTFVAVAELDGRVSILDQNNAPVQRVGDNPQRDQWGNFHLSGAQLQDSVLTAPHGLSWDGAGSLYIQEWNLQGRLVKWQRVP